MKKKTGKVFLITAGVLLLLWGAMVTTDSIRCSSLKEPIFVVPGITQDDGGSGTYHGIGYEVEIKKHIDPEFGLCVDAVEMKMFGKVISASIV